MTHPVSHHKTRMHGSPKNCKNAAISTVVIKLKTIKRIMVVPGPHHPLHQSPSFSKKDEERTSTEKFTGGVIQTGRKRLIVPLEKKADGPRQRSVRFSDAEPSIVTIPSLSQGEVSDMFYTKEEKKEMKWQIKTVVTKLRIGTLSKEEEEEQRIGLESHINPTTKYQTRKRLIRLVLNHQRWSVLHTSMNRKDDASNFFNDEFLAKNCRSVTSPSRRMAFERALRVLPEPATEPQPQQQQEDTEKPSWLSAPPNVVMAR